MTSLFKTLKPTRGVMTWQARGPRMAAPVPHAELAEVVPGLLLGASSWACMGGAALEARGVTHLVNCTPDAPDPVGVRGAFSLWRVPVADDLNAPLHAHLEVAAAFMEAALSGGGIVCAFCHDGNSTAPAVIAFYLMRQKQLSLAQALDAVAAARPEAQPNVGFWQRLVEAESWLRSGDATAASTPSLSLQQYKWRFLQRMEPSEERGATLQQLELGRAEVAELIRVRSEQWTLG